MCKENAHKYAIYWFLFSFFMRKQKQSDSIWTWNDCLRLCEFNTNVVCSQQIISSIIYLWYILMLLSQASDKRAFLLEIKRNLYVVVLKLSTQENRNSENCLFNFPISIRTWNYFQWSIKQQSIDQTLKTENSKLKAKSKLWSKSFGFALCVLLLQLNFNFSA